MIIEYEYTYMTYTEYYQIVITINYPLNQKNVHRKIQEDALYLVDNSLSPTMNTLAPLALIE